MCSKSSLAKHTAEGHYSITILPPSFSLRGLGLRCGERVALSPAADGFTADENEMGGWSRTPPCAPARNVLGDSPDSGEFDWRCKNRRERPDTCTGPSPSSPPHDSAWRRSQPNVTAFASARLLKAASQSACVASGAASSTVRIC